MGSSSSEFLINWDRVSEASDGTPYPRPQFQRVRQPWTSLNGSWKFCFDDERRYRQPSEVTKWPQTIEVPFAPETEKSGIGDTGFHPCCWYQREFEAPKGNGKVLLHFGAVDYCARVWVNDHFAGSHEGGYS